MDSPGIQLFFSAFYLIIRVTGEMEHHLNKQGKVVKEFGYCKLKLMSLQSDVDIESS